MSDRVGGPTFALRLFPPNEAGGAGSFATDHDGRASLPLRAPCGERVAHRPSPAAARTTGQLCLESDVDRRG